MHHIDGLFKLKDVLEKRGYEVEVPDFDEGPGYAGLTDEQHAIKKEGFIQQHLGRISDSDAILIYNDEKNGIAGYVGGNCLMEMAFAYSQNIEIFLLNDARAMSYADEIYAMRPIILGGELEAIDNHFESLPKVFVSSKSPIKLRSINRGMRAAGIRVRALPHPTQSNVAEQPRNIEETYEGAQNRHEALKHETASETVAYLATIESGLFAAHPKHNAFSSTVVILEAVGSERKIGISVELEYPKAMTDKIPSQYADLGELVQAEYGSALKDPFPYFTGGKINRLRLVENAVFNVAVQLKAD